MTIATPARDESTRLRVLLVAENISLKQSGETSVPYFYLDRLLKRDVDVQAICHARVRDDLRETLPPDMFERIHFVEESPLQTRLWKLSRFFHYRIADLVFNQLIYVITQARMRSLAKRIVRDRQIDIVLQPVPISPKTPSFMFGLGVPVVIGPMCGGLELPPAFRHMDGAFVNLTIHAARALAALIHRFIPGKLQAAALLVGNQRTAKALPRGTRGKIYEVVESGADLARWAPKTYPVQSDGGPVRFVFCGRLVDWKGAQYLVKAFAALARERSDVHLDLIGDGELYESIQKQIVDENMGHAITMHGRIPLERCIELMRNGDVYVMPSLRECGGLALLEAMALGLPIVACNWMGPAEYLDASSAILVDPVSEQGFIDGFTDAMRRLADSPELRRSLGEGAQRRVHAGYYGWDRKVDRVLEILRQVLRDQTGRTYEPGLPVSAPNETN